MTLQEIFDTVIEHLRKQNAKSQISDGQREVCLYRSPEGLKCAAGCLIPDEYYIPEMERNGWEDVVQMFDLPDYLKDPDSINLVASLQFIHDSIPISFWEIKFKAMAEYYKLVYGNPANV